MTCGVYKLTAPSGNFYIGSSKHIEVRLRAHAKLLRAGRHHNIALERSYLRHGLPTPSVVLVCREEDLIMYEQLCIDGLRPKYNRSRTAGRVTLSPEALAQARKQMIKAWSCPALRARQSENTKRTWRDPEFRAQKSADAHALWARPGFREMRSEQAKVQFSDPAARAHVSAARTGCRDNAESRLKRSVSQKARRERERLERQL